ncbi:hypothetical protein MTR67_051507 [Solanum verrucosum]|uniref:Tf2-1-like SH3-like domain-containing protein n=1 Tax=Solanum verrucosum TaxID=315347 RepID=A0AAF0V506_SOLVR|nr:hypothetical protein MTR67_051507 [Solanum verrucosum]
MKGVMRFWNKGKLSPLYVDPYYILRRIGKFSYELYLPNDLASVHPVFHVSLLKKCGVGDPMFVLPLESLDIKDSLIFFLIFYFPSLSSPLFFSLKCHQPLLSPPPPPQLPLEFPPPPPLPPLKLQLLLLLPPPALHHNQTHKI